MSQISRNNNNKKMVANKPKNVLPKRKRNANKTKPSNVASKLSKCSLKYALALSAPFDPLAIGACNPGFRTTNTHKVSCMGAFTATVGTAGSGFVAVLPALGNNNICAYYTGSTYAGGGALNLLNANNSLSIGISTFSLANLPYSAANLQAANGVAQASGVLVSMGLRITYSGTTLNEGGMYFSYVDNTHSSIAGVAPSAITVRQETFIRGVDRNPLELCIGAVDADESDVAIDNTQSCYYPYSSGETTFNSNFTYQDAGGISAAPPIGAVYFTGTPGNTFYVEIIEHIEYIGTLPSASYTPHDSDSVGAAKVQSAAVGLSALKKSEPKHVGSAWPFMYKALATVAMGVAEVVMPQTAAAVQNLLTKH